MCNDTQLLKEYVLERSETAFKELVERHLNLVYSTASRYANGDSVMAEDITQMVFTELARKAGDVCRHPALAGWLYTCVRNVAANLKRSEQRRLVREKEACSMLESNQSNEDEVVWMQVRPVLDEAMHELDEKDRAVVILRFFEQRSLREVGVNVGINENAARMRVDRALDRLRDLLARRGINSHFCKPSIRFSGRIDFCGSVWFGRHCGNQCTGCLRFNNGFNFYIHQDYDYDKNESSFGRFPFGRRSRCASMATRAH